MPKKKIKKQRADMVRKTSHLICLASDSTHNKVPTRLKLGNQQARDIALAVFTIYYDSLKTL